MDDKVLISISSTISTAVGAATVFLGVWITQHYTTKREHEQRREQRLFEQEKIDRTEFDSAFVNTWNYLNQIINKGIMFPHELNSTETLYLQKLNDIVISYTPMSTNLPIWQLVFIKHFYKRWTRHAHEFGCLMCKRTIIYTLFFMRYIG